MKAVVFVDVQNDFIDGALKNDKAIEVTPKIVEFAKECVKNGYKLYATRDTHEKSEMTTAPIYKDCYGIMHEGKPMKKNDEGVYVREPSPVSGYLTTLEGRKLPVEHCIEGTDGWMIDNRLMKVLDGHATFVNKHTFGSFDLADIMEEDLEAWDDKNYFEEIILVGYCTDVCVISNALLLRAKFPNTKITIKENMCAGVTSASHTAALTTAMMCQIDVE